MQDVSINIKDAVTHCEFLSFILSSFDPSDSSVPDTYVSGQRDESKGAALTVGKMSKISISVGLSKTISLYGPFSFDSNGIDGSLLMIPAFLNIHLC